MNGRKLKIGDIVVITNTYGKNYGKQGIVSEISKEEVSGRVWRVYLRPLNCEFEFDHYSPNTCNAEGLHGWSPGYLSFPSKKTKKIEKRDQTLMFKFVGTEGDVKRMTEEVKRIVQDVAPEARLKIQRETREENKND